MQSLLRDWNYHLWPLSDNMCTHEFYHAQKNYQDSFVLQTSQNISGGVDVNWPLRPRRLVCGFCVQFSADADDLTGHYILLAMQIDGDVRPGSEWNSLIFCTNFWPGKTNIRFLFYTSANWRKLVISLWQCPLLCSYLTLELNIVLQPNQLSLTLPYSYLSSYFVCGYSVLV